MLKDEKVVLFDISPYMTEDGPGIRTVFFTKGCPLRCKWCSNAYGLRFGSQLASYSAKCTKCGRCIDICPNDSVAYDESNNVQTDYSKCSGCGRCVDVCLYGARTIIGKEFTSKDILEIAKKDVDFYKRDHGGVTFSGGEVLSQADVVAESLKLCSENEISTTIETSAYGKWEDLKLLLSNVEFAFIDIKHMDNETHKKLTGVSNHIILENIKKASEFCEANNIPLVLRFPLIPGYNDNDLNITATGNYTLTLAGEHEINVLPYHEYGAGKYNNIGEDYRFEVDSSGLAERLENLKNIFRNIGVNFSIGGGNVEQYHRFHDSI